MVLKGIPWLTNADGALCFICKTEVEALDHFVVNCPNFKDQLESLWSSLGDKIISSNSIVVGAIADFIKNLKHYQIRFLCAGKDLQSFSSLVCELEAPWLVSQ